MCYFSPMSETKKSQATQTAGRHEFKHEGQIYSIEKDQASRGYNENTAKWNQDGTPRTRAGWVWYIGNNTHDDACACWASSLASAKEAIQGNETGDICFE